MKTRMLLFCCLCAVSFIAADKPSNYEEIMRSNIEKLFAANALDQLQQIANTFDRIGLKESERWQPSYYGAYAYLIMSNFVAGPDEKDQMLDQALERVAAAKERATNHSEIITLEGFVHMLRIPIDPAGRGPQYAGLGMAAFQKAIGLDPENPRAHLLMSDMQFGTAQFFGSDTGEACSNLQKAVDLFTSFVPKSNLDPDWGKEMAEQRLLRCK